MKNVNIKNQNDNAKCKVLECIHNFEFLSVIFHFDFYTLIYK